MSNQLLPNEPGNQAFPRIARGDLAAKKSPLTEVGNGQRLIEKHGSKMHFNVSRKKWMKWTGKHWMEDDKLQVSRWAKTIARSFFAEAGRTSDRNIQDEILRHAKASEKAGGIKAMLEMAQSEAGIAVTPEQFDADPWALNVQNGTIDLRTGKLRDHDPADLMTKIAPVKYEPDAKCVMWDNVLDRAMAKNKDMIGYLGRIVGLWLTGDITVQELYIFLGNGANGKNVFVDTIANMIGDYASTAPDKFLTAKTFDEHPTEFADLLGRRVVVSSELDAGEVLRVSLIKRLTGDEKIKGRYMRKDYFEFLRTHKTLIVTNNKPIIRETTNAIWRRVRLIPWNVIIPKDEQDPQLTIKLRQEWPGILNWAIKGCLDWQKSGMNTPQEVLVASQEYRSEQDATSEFLQDCLVQGSGLRVTRNKLYDSYNMWCKITQQKHVLERDALYLRVRTLNPDNPIEEGDWRENVDGDSKTRRGFIGVGLCESER